MESFLNALQLVLDVAVIVVVIFKFFGVAGNNDFVTVFGKVNHRKRDIVAAKAVTRRMG